MKNTRGIAFLLFFVFMFSISPLYAKEEKINRKPEPYGIDEFNTWQKDLRRFEIISLGAMPFVSLLSFWGYDIIRSVKHKGDPAYKPWPLKNPEIAKPLTQDEQKKIFASIVGISIGIALIDFSYRAIKRSIEKKKGRPIQKETEEAIELIPMDDLTSSLENETEDLKPKIDLEEESAEKKQFESETEITD